jgi:hypothetical protein
MILKKIESQSLLFGILAISVVMMTLLYGYNYLRLREKDDLEDNYWVLYNQSATFENYYDTLLFRYNESRLDYEALRENYTVVMKENYDLKKEYFDVLNHKKRALLEEQRSITLEGGENVTLSYIIPASGYIELEYISTREIYLWVGSTVSELLYYSRYPSFPETASQASLKIPVSPDLLVFFSNPNENEANVEINLSLVY